MLQAAKAMDFELATVLRDTIATLNADAVLAQRLQTHPADVVAVSGAVGRRLWQVVMQAATARPALRLVVQDGTRLFVDASAISAFRRLGAEVLAWRGIRMLGLTLNPFSPFGGSFEAANFLRWALGQLEPSGKPVPQPLPSGDEPPF
jgi:hypothetical protein